MAIAHPNYIVVPHACQDGHHSDINDSWGHAKLPIDYVYQMEANPYLAKAHDIKRQLYLRETVLWGSLIYTTVDLSYVCKSIEGSLPLGMMRLHLLYVVDISVEMN